MAIVSIKDPEKEITLGISSWALGFNYYIAKFSGCRRQSAGIFCYVAFGDYIYGFAKQQPSIT